MPSDRGSTSGSGRSHTNGTTTRIITTRVEPGPPTELDPDVISKVKHEEWTTSKKVVNHKTKQVETRVQRQIIMEDGKVVADSGPQVTTKTKEDSHTEETENTQHKTTGDNDQVDGYIPVPGSERVVNEKTETHQVMKENKEESMRLHDENFSELTGNEIHRKALVAANQDDSLDDLRKRAGKLTHFSSRCQKVTDKEEVKEVSELKDGELSTQTTRTHHHEEMDDDEVPEDEVEGTALPERSAETTRNIEYYRDGDVPDSWRKADSRLREERKAPTWKNAISSHTEEHNEEEDVIRNSKTNRWLEDHFGSDQSDISDSSQTRARGNVINIEMSGGRRPGSQNATKSDGSKWHSTSNGMTWNHSTRPVSSTPKSRSPLVVRVDSSASPPPQSLRSPGSSYLSTSRTPLKKYYLGENGSYKPDGRSRVQNSTLKRQSAPWKSTPSLVNDYYQGHRHNSFHHESRQNSRSVHRSQSDREPSPQKYTVCDLASPERNQHETWTKSLPRGTKPPQGTQRRQHVLSSRHSTDRSVQVDLSDDDEPKLVSSTFPRRRSPSPIRHFNGIDTYTLPRKYETSSPREYITTFSSRPSPVGNNFYYGNKNGFHSPNEDRARVSSGDFYGSIPSRSSGYHTIERGRHVKDILSDSRHHSSAFNNRTYGYPDDSYFHSTSSRVASGDDRSFRETRVDESHDRRRHKTENGAYETENFECLHEHEGKSYSNGPLHISVGDLTNGSDPRRQRFMQDLLSPSEDASSWMSPSRRRAPELRQRHYSPDDRPPPPPSTSPPVSPPPRLIRASSFGGSASPSPPQSPPMPPPPPPLSNLNLYNSSLSRSRQKNRPSDLLTIRAHSPIHNLPSFKPLLSPTEIKNMSYGTSTSTHRETSRTSRHRESMDKPSGSVRVEVRDWENR